MMVEKGLTEPFQPCRDNLRIICPHEVVKNNVEILAGFSSRTSFERGLMIFRAQPSKPLPKVFKSVSLTKSNLV